MSMVSSTSHTKESALRSSGESSGHKSHTGNIALIVSLIVCVISVINFLQAPGKELEQRVRVVESRIATIDTNVEWIKRSQERVESRVVSRFPHGMEK